MRHVTNTELTELEMRQHVTEHGVPLHYTTVIEKQEWHDTPANGQYAGKTYRITTLYVSNRPGHRHTMLRRTSEPWTE